MVKRMKVSRQSRETMLAASTAGKEAAIDETVAELKNMLEKYGYKVQFIGNVENVYVFDEMEEVQKIIVHHDPVYDCGDFWFSGGIEEYNL